MFVLPDNIVRKIINKEEPYDSIFGQSEITDTIRNNESSKGYRFEDQARVNLSLEKNYKPICSVLEDSCLRTKCPLFKKGDTGKLKEGWVCREYKIDFPDAPFNLRYHVSRIGINSIDVDETLKHIEKLGKNGGKNICLGCHKVYENIPKQNYEDGHGGRMIDMCGCGSDLFEKLESFLESYKCKSKSK